MIYIYPNKPNWIDKQDIKLYEKPNWIAERKKNGWRCLAYRNQNNLELWTRHHTLIPDLLPKTRSLLMQLTLDTVIDGELIDKRTKDVKDEYYAFDILFFEGKPLVNVPWKERRKILENLNLIVGMELSEPINLGKRMLYDMAVKDGDEGIVLKEINSTYIVDLKSCQNNPLWLKAKRPESCFKTMSR